jgi:hypothetical protein
LEKKFGMKAKEIGRITGHDEKVVRERIKLLRLPPDVQERVHLGKLAQHRALAMLDEKKAKDIPVSSEVRRLPPMKEIEKLYSARQDQLPDDYEPFVTEDVRKLFAFWLKLTYAPRSEGQSDQPTEQGVQAGSAS